MAGALHQSNGHDATDDSPESLAAQLTAPTAVRKLVLNYLLHHCYIDTAQAFADDGISAHEDIQAAGSSSAASSTAAPSTSGAKGRPYPGSGSTSGPSRRAGTSSVHSRSASSRLAPSAATAHPLSAPPLSREDSSMEVEADSLLSLANAGAPGEAHASPSSKGKNGASNTAAHEEEEHNSLRGHRGSQELTAEELQHVRIRKEVRDHIVAGRVRQAVDLCNRHFPSVLNATDSHTKSSSRTPASAGAAENGDKSGNGKIERVLPANPTSLDPAHLSLNLQIQAFIEIVRTASSGNGTSPTLASSTPSLPINAYQGASAMPSMQSIVQNTPGIAAAAISRSASPAPSSSSSTGSATSGNAMSGSAHSGAGGSSTLVNPALHAALRHAQNLYSDVQSLPAYWRAMYLKELESVTTMLAYTDLERSPVRKYLDQNRRVALAEQINSAIMYRTGRPSQPLIESAVRQTTFCWSTFANEKIAVPANHALFTSGILAGFDSFDNAPEASGTAGGSGISTALAAVAAAQSASASGTSKSKGKLLPAWTLHEFLRER